MADIELVIKISEKIYNRFGYEYSEENLISKYTNDVILEAFCNGTQLPRGHGRLIDADAFIKTIENTSKRYKYKELPVNDVLKAVVESLQNEGLAEGDAPTIIEADRRRE